MYSNAQCIPLRVDNKQLIEQDEAFPVSQKLLISAVSLNSLKWKMQDLVFWGMRLPSSLWCSEVSFSRNRQFCFFVVFLKFFKLKLPSKLESHLPLSGRQYVKKRVKPIHLTKYSGLFIYTQSSILYSKNWFISRCIGMNPTVHMLYSNIQVMNIYMILEWLFCSYSNGTNYAQK